jgi:hypothetical protein
MAYRDDQQPQDDFGEERLYEVCAAPPWPPRHRAAGAEAMRAFGADADPPMT